MKTTKILTAVVTLVTISVFASSAEAGFGSKFRSHFPKPRFFAPRPYVPAPVFPMPVPVHYHSYSCHTEQIWVPPVYQTVVVGYEACGTPVYQQVVTQAGYYRTVRYNVCSCGHRYYL